MTAAKPAWLARCVPADIRRRSYDALEFLEPHEVDYDWRLCRVPIAALPVWDAERFSESFETAAAAEQRLAAIRAWMRKRGGAEAALRARPILATLKARGLTVLDGYHRISAAASLGLQEVPALIGTPRRKP